MTSSNGTIFRVTGPLWGEFIGDQWIPLKSQWRGVLMFCLIGAWTNGSATIEASVIWDAIALIMTSLISPRITSPVPWQYYPSAIEANPATMDKFGYRNRTQQNHARGQKFGKYIYRSGVVHITVLLYGHSRCHRSFIPNKTTSEWYCLTQDFKAPQELSKAVPGKFDGSVGHSKRNILQYVFSQGLGIATCSNF